MTMEQIPGSVHLWSL